MTASDIILKCTCCGERKPATEFHIKRSTKSGRQSQCKLCVCAKIKVYYTANTEAAKNRNYEYRNMNREKFNEYMKKYMRTHYQQKRKEKANGNPDPISG